MASSRVVDDPYIGWLARHAGMIDVRPGKDAYGAAREALDRGEIVGIYPEGDALSPLPDGSPRQFRLGVGKLALHAQAPVIPIAHHDAREIGSGSIGRTLAGAITAIARRPTIRIGVGEPIPGEKFAGLTARDAADLVRDHVMDLWRNISARKAD
jgi:1-acyl-sn-glycerol-3-phosphate acyltransferase